MKYYTPELIALGQSDDDDVLDEQDRLWEEAAARYVAYLDSVRGQFPPGLKRIVDSYYLHDATVLSIGRRGPAFALVLQLDTPPRSILTFNYKLLSEPIIEQDSLPPQARLESAPPLWLYNELEAVGDGPGGWRENLLLSNGWEVVLHFRNISVEELDAILPTPGNVHARKADLERAQPPVQSQPAPPKREPVRSQTTKPAPQPYGAIPQVNLRVTPEEAARQLGTIRHHKCQRAIGNNWKVYDGQVAYQSVAWLFCWACSGMGSDQALRDARRVFNCVFDISYDDYDAKVGYTRAQTLRY
jgi:hypothetical protein